MRAEKRNAWALCAAWMGVIFMMSAMPAEVSGEQSGSIVQVILAAAQAVLGEHAPGFHADHLELLVRKGAHMAEFAVLFLLYCRALRLSGAKRVRITAFALCVLYAATDEFHQRFVPGRGPAISDVLIDSMGAAIAWGAAAAHTIIRRKKEK